LFRKLTNDLKTKDEYFIIDLKHFDSRINRKLILIFALIIIIGLGAGILIGINLSNSDNSVKPSGDFPDFITKNEDYFITRIGPVPRIASSTYRLKVWGKIFNPRNFTLSELQGLNLTDRTLTTECIGNPPKGRLLSTAIWRGFLMYEFLESLGLKASATGVKYTAADGYYVSHTLDQLRNNGTLGALYMNGKILPAVQGFPLRIVNPGYFGAKQPAWVTDIEVIDRPLEDFWDDRSWDTSPPMDVDSTIFFPQDFVEIRVGVPLEIGGAAFGGTRISKVEFTINEGINWNLVNITESIDADHVWVFWNVLITFNVSGDFSFYSKATDIYNNSQPINDPVTFNGTNSWPRLIIKVIN
jgi:DMSO/TMAO reductase YedYZ molybdopterin-dependent catalytic subunit